jgi:SAM-dependent methyltransferase
MQALDREMIQIRHVPGDTRSAYNAIYSGSGIRHPEWMWPWLLDLLGARPGMRLLDVACGEGQLLRYAAAMGVDAHGVDLSDIALTRAAAGSGRVRLAAANGEQLPYADATFDLVTNLGSLEHYEDPAQGAAEMARVLAPNGLVCLHVPNTFGLRWSVMYAWRHGRIHDDGQPIQRYGTRDQWTRLLESASLRVLRVLPFDEPADLPERGAQWPALLVRHPSRLLIPLTRLLPVDMASIFLFVCTRA